MSVRNSAPDAIFEQLRSSRSRDAWVEFLRQYSPVIFHTCQLSSSDGDQAADCFVFACEQLSRNRFHRLLQYRADRGASLATWLHVVVRNLCLDWRRKRFGRSRPFRSVARLTQLEAEVYRCRHERGLSLEETFLSLCPSFPGLTLQRVTDTDERVRESLSSRQLWLISLRSGRARGAVEVSGVAVAEEDDGRVQDPADPHPDQESVLASQEQKEHLRSLVAKLPAPERLLIRMRFEEGLSLEEIAGLTGLGDAQRVHRRMAEVVEKLRNEFT
jgi:RNA polymerase sigma factor (sigma-70 family)